jgi:hypothetical protein
VIARKIASRAGCCTACKGTGFSGDDAVPGGMCWDCQATGHPHAGPCAPDWLVRTHVVLRWLTAVLMFVGWVGVVTTVLIQQIGVVFALSAAFMIVGGPGWAALAIYDYPYHRGER